MATAPNRLASQKKTLSHFPTLYVRCKYCAGKPPQREGEEKFPWAYDGKAPQGKGWDRGTGQGSKLEIV